MLVYRSVFFPGIKSHDVMTFMIVEITMNVTSLLPMMCHVSGLYTDYECDL